MNIVIMPALDCLEYTQHAVEDVLNQSLPSTLLLIDQGSREDFRAWRRTLSPKVLQWSHDPPLPSLAAVWNRALRFAWEAGADHALVINNDLRLHRDTYRVLLEVMHTAQAWFVSAVSVREGQFDPTIDLYAGLGTVTESRHDGMKPEGYSYGGPDFSCFVISKECHQLYAFDQNFIPAYAEDCSYHRTLLLDGWHEKIFGVNVPFLHYGSGTLNAMTPELRVRKEGQITAGSRAYYARLWGGPPNAEQFIRPGGPERYRGVTNPDLLAAGQAVGALLDGAERIATPDSTTPD